MWVKKRGAQSDCEKGSDQCMKARPNPDVGTFVAQGPEMCPGYVGAKDLPRGLYPSMKEVAQAFDVHYATVNRIVKKEVVKVRHDLSLAPCVGTL